MSTVRSRWLVCFSLVALTAGLACAPQDSPTPEAGADGLFAPKPPGGCDFGTMTKDARDYFPGNGKGSQLDQALDLVSLLTADCSAGQPAAYTAHWFELAELVGNVLKTGTGMDAVKGGQFLTTSVLVKAASGARMFVPCGVATDDCLPWDGFPATTPDFASVLGSPDGAWTVVTTDTAAVCSSFVSPCNGWDAETLGDAWGVEPSATWEGALHGRRTLVFGRPLRPLSGLSPTGEVLVNTELPAYQWLLIPDPAAFGVELEVGLCSTEPSRIAELLVQKGQTILTEAVLDWCTPFAPLARVESSRFDRLISFLSPRPAPLVALGLGGASPGGSAGGFTDFYAVDLPRAAVLVPSGQPSDGYVGQAITGPGGQPFSIRALTFYMESPLESALVHVQIIGNGGLIPSGSGVSGAGLLCSDFACDGRTQADQEASPGTLNLPLVFTKPGQYSMCFTAQQAPLQFGDPVCTAKFNVRP